MGMEFLDQKRRVVLLEISFTDLKHKIIQHITKIATAAEL